MCIYPRTITNPKYRTNKKNNGTIPDAIDDRCKVVAIGCGKCIECRNMKKRNWQIRLHEEIKNDNTGKFVTLTFDEEELSKLCVEIDTTESNAVAIFAVRRFLERWRKKKGKSVKHWLITELGHENTERIHLHGIIWTNENEEFIKERWKYGNIWVGKYVNAKTINYIVKYVNKIDLKHKGYEGAVCCSAGIGKSYINKTNIDRNKYKNEKTNENYKLPNGFEIPLPIYYRNKFYNDLEREKLWLNKLDKNERYIRGVKYKCENEEDLKIIENALEQAQRENAILGYGDNTIDWRKQNYNVSLRILNKIKKLEDYKSKSKK